MTSELQIDLPFENPQFVKLCRELDIAYLGLFGSSSRGEEGLESDLDLLVRFSEPKSLLDIVATERKLEEFLGREIDLITEGGLHPRIRDGIRQDLLDIYGTR